MEQLEYDYNVFDQQAAESDKHLAVRFFTMPVQDMDKSAAEGRPIFNDVVHAEIRVRGDRNNIVHKPVDETIKRRFRDAWRAYEQGKELMQQGTPLAEWPVVTKSMVEELKYFGFYTVEQVAEARSDVVSKFPGLTSIQQRAKNFLELAKGTAPLEKMQSELDKVSSEKAALEAQVQDLGRRLAAMEAKSSK